MASKVFISWSGELSRSLAEALNDWFHEVIQTLDTYYSPRDIDKGSKWDGEISKSLEESNVGLICLTKDNINSPWILFEAGALSKKITDKSRVCTVLFNIANAADVEQPLGGFQATLFNKDDFEKLIKTIFNACETGISEYAIVQKSFDRSWPEFETKIKEILSTNKDSHKPSRKDRELLEEILSLTRNMADREGRSTYANPRLSKRMSPVLDRHVMVIGEILELLEGAGFNPKELEQSKQRLIESIEMLCMELDIPPQYIQDILVRFPTNNPLMRRIRHSINHEGPRSR